MEYYKYLLSGLLILGLLHQGFAKSIKRSTTNDEMQADDDYNYNDDDSVAVADPITTSNSKSTIAPTLQETSLVEFAIEGQNLHLKCSVLNRSPNNVFLWYHGVKLLANHQKILDDRYKIENTTTSNNLIINNIKMEDAGDYFCKVLPQSLQLEIKVNVLPKGSVISTTIKPLQETTTSDNKSSSIKIESSFSLMLSLVLSMLAFLRI